MGHNILTPHHDSLLVAPGYCPGRWSVLLLAILFGVAYPQFPLYHDTQNQYFFHGLVRAGMGLLRLDWLAGTTDVWPVFSALVTLTYRYLDVRMFYGYFFVLLAVYAYAMWGIVTSVWVGLRAWPKTVVFFALLAALHSPWVGELSTAAVGFSVGAQLTSGVALQELLGRMLQPSTFGAFLLVSVLAFLRGKPLPALVWAALAATIHPTYILTAAVLILSYLAVLWRRGRRFHALVRLSLWALLLLLPVLTYVAVAFRPTSADLVAQAQAILVHYRFPHHAYPARWWGPMVYVKLAVVMVALGLVRRSALFIILLALSAGAAGLTVLQVLSGSDRLALLFPWRLSVVLMPLATALTAAGLASWGVDWLTRRFPGTVRLAAGCGVLLLVALTAVGVRETWRRFTPGHPDHRAALFEHVRETKSPGALYLIPPYWDNFRLATGAPAFIDWDFIPYDDWAVLEWYRRFRLADAFYKATGGERCRILRDLAARERITDVALRGQSLEACGPWRLVFHAGDHRLYRLGPQ
ncbi:MAG: DUF6798 domain-containing protein [Armatimonadota bacterium]|nr:DUF6798 domain-containing protein [Armatimonadota bacterium]